MECCKKCTRESCAFFPQTTPNLTSHTTLEYQKKDIDINTIDRAYLDIKAIHALFCVHRSMKFY